MTTLTMRDEKRIEIIQRVFRGELTVLRAAVILGISERQCYLIKGRVHQQGPKGVIHRNRGRPCKRKVKEKIVRRVAALARGKTKYLTITISPRSLKSTSRSISVGRRSVGSERIK